MMHYTERVERRTLFRRIMTISHKIPCHHPYKLIERNSRLAPTLFAHGWSSSLLYGIVIVYASEACWKVNDGVWAANLVLYAIFLYIVSYTFTPLTTKPGKDLLPSRLPSEWWQRYSMVGGWISWNCYGGRCERIWINATWSFDCRCTKHKSCIWLLRWW